ncbi:MAG: acetylxylan esterase [Verrucomicrobiota bacterium]
MAKIFFTAAAIWFLTVGNLFAVQDLNTPRVFPKVETKAEWQKRAKEIREQILVSCGLWPMPAKTPLNSRVFGKLVRDGYTIEKVFFQSYPGFYVGGNLYRPDGKGKYPGILNPHGHWENGRMVDTDAASIAARCINFARQGMIAFSYDMVGYNDTFFADQTNNVPATGWYKRHRQFATDATNLLWNVNLMGLQTWNSIRALDFLESLPDVDKARLACTGESGGGTQTFMLGAIDGRLAAQAPVVMVSHSMQGGCSCENAPGLRVEYSNMEIAAAAAPRPQIMIGATGDWTKTMMTVEGPAIESIYRLFRAGDQLSYCTFDFPHNYNQTSREAVYGFFGKVLQPRWPTRNETAYTKEADEELRVFPDEKLPVGALGEMDLIRDLIANDLAQQEALQPKDKKSLARYKEIMTPLWKHTLQLGGLEKRNFEITFVPKSSRSRGMAVLADSEGKSAFMDQNKNPRGLAKLLVERNFQVLVLDFPNVATVSQDQSDLFFTTYNRTFAQERVRDLVSACAWGKKSGGKVVLFGRGRAGWWSLLAAPAADAVVVDCDELDVSSDAGLLKPDLFIPGLRKLGTFEGSACLAAPHPIFLNVRNPGFSGEGLRKTYSFLKRPNLFRQESTRIDDESVADWITNVPLP